MSDTQILSNHFTVGNVIRSNYWGTFDLVLAFQPTTNDQGWFVTVQDCNASGEINQRENPRVHYTYPDSRDQIVCNVQDAR